MDYKEFCFNEYKSLFEKIFEQLPIKTKDTRRIIAQKQAIREASIKAIKKFPEIEPSQIWKTIYIAHVYNVSKISDSKIIDAIISADNSWKKSSGHAFEEMIKELGNLSLKEHGIEIVLQKDLNGMIKTNQVLNEVRDVSWLKEQVNSSVFDLYLTIKQENGYTVFGCIQSKTSIRDRVTRDREPSINAMKAFFLSLAIVLDGDFLKLPKFIGMVNGNTSGYEINGWHGMYVLSNNAKENDRIHRIDITMEKFVQHVVQASEFWVKQRQWFDHAWRPEMKIFSND
jgi:hypothetical protein